MTMGKSLVFLAVATILLLSVALAIPVVFSDSEPIKRYLLQKVGNAIGGHVATEHLELQLFVSPEIRLNGFVLREREEGQPLFQLEDGICELELLALLIGQIVIDHCLLNNPMITLRRQEDGSWRWLIFPEAEEDPRMSLITFSGLKKIGVNKGHITLIDETDTQYRRSMSLSHIKAIITVKLESNQIEFQASANLSNPKSSSTLSIAGHLQTQAHTQTFAIQQASARIEASNVELRPLLKFMEPGIRFTTQKPAVNLQATILLFPDQAGYTLVAKKFSAWIGELGIHGKSSFTGLLSRQPAFIFTATAPAFNIETLMQHIPFQWFPQDIQTVLLKYKYGGNVQVEQFTVSGPLTEGTDLSVIGKFTLSNGWMNLDPSFSTLKNIQGTVALNQDHLTLNDVSLEFESSKIVNAYGYIELRTPHPSLMLTANAHVFC